MTDEARDEAIRSAVAARWTMARDVMSFVHAHPELAHEEHETSAYLARVLTGLGLVVETGIAGMATAFRATLRGGLPGRTVGLVANYDAVPSVPAAGGLERIHACGHGPISAGIVVALAALAADRDRLCGSVVAMGCPADEIHSPGTVARGGGKAITAATGAWDGFDAALYAHPEFLDTVWSASAWMRRDTARLYAGRTLVTGAPQTALTATTTLVSAAAAAPAAQVMLESLHFDGDVEEGTGVGALASFLLWAPNEAGIEELSAGLRAAVPAADWEAGQPVPGIVPDAAVGAAVAASHRAAGRSYVDPPMALPFATDFGAITRRVPSALIGVGRPGGWSFHTPEGATQFASADGLEAAVSLATVMALAAERLVAPA